MKIKKTYRLEQDTIDELGKRNPTVNSLEKIVAGYGLTLKEFFAKMPD